MVKKQARTRKPIPDIAVLRWIAAYYNAHGYMPTVREICAGMGFTSTNGPRPHIAAFRKLGWMARADGRARTLRITPLGMEALRDAG